MPFEGIGRHHLKVTFWGHFPAQPTGPSLLNEGLIYCAISFYWHVLFSSFPSLLPSMLSLLFSFGPGGRRLRGDFPALLLPCNSFQPCSSVRKSKDEQLHTCKHASVRLSSQALKFDAFLPHEILVPQWRQSEASGTSNITEPHPPLKQWGGDWWDWKPVQSFEKFPLCGTLWCKCFSLNAGHSLFDDDDVIFLRLLPSVQIFRPKSPDLINLPVFSSSLEPCHNQ